MKLKEALKVVGVLGLGGIIGWCKGTVDAAVAVGEGHISKERCERLVAAINDLSDSLFKKNTTEKVAEDITEMVSDAAEEVAEAVEEAADSEEESDKNQPED